MNASDQKMLGLIDLSSLPCGCPECDETVQPGHFACSVSEQWCLDMEEGTLVRNYNGTSWVWERA